MEIFKFGIFEDFSGELSQGISMKGVDFDFEGGERDLISQNYGELCERIGLDCGKITHGIQEHTDKVIYVDKAGGLFSPYKGVDGFITDKVGEVLCVRIGDCQGAIFYEPKSRVIGAVHCGWRGNAQNILGKTVIRLREVFGIDPSKILVAVSPSLGPCCAKFSDPFAELPEEMHKFILEDGRVDLWECSFSQLRAQGVKSENIEIARRCTKCEEENFYSHRRGERGRMACVVGMR